MAVFEQATCDRARSRSGAVQGTALAAETNAGSHLFKNACHDMLAGVGDAQVAPGMLEIDTEHIRAERQRAFDEILVFVVGRQIEVTAWVRSKRCGGLRKHVSEWRVVIKHLQHPEAQLVVASRLLIDYGRGTDFNHGRSVQQTLG